MNATLRSRAVDPSCVKAFRPVWLLCSLTPDLKAPSSHLVSGSCAGDRKPVSTQGPCISTGVLLPPCVGRAGACHASHRSTTYSRLGCPQGVPFSPVSPGMLADSEVIGRSRGQVAARCQSASAIEQGFSDEGRRIFSQRIDDGRADQMQGFKCFDMVGMLVQPREQEVLKQAGICRLSHAGEDVNRRCVGKYQASRSRIPAGLT